MKNEPKICGMNILIVTVINFSIIYFIWRYDFAKNSEQMIISRIGFMTASTLKLYFTNLMTFER